MGINNLPDIRTLWIGGELSRLEYVCLNSFLKQGHNVYLYTYGEVKNIPPGVRVVDGNDILDKSKIFTYGSATGKGKGSYAGFANQFRYKMLEKISNCYWVDADVLCLKPFSLNQDVVIGKESKNFINNAVIGSKDSGNEIFRALSTYCEYPFKIKIWDSYKIIIRKIIGKTYGRSSLDYLPWGVTGPKALTGFAKKFKIEATGVDEFYPISSDNWRDIFFHTERSFSIKLENSSAIHLWNEMLRREGLDKNSKFENNSLYERLIQEFELDD